MTAQNSSTEWSNSEPLKLLAVMSFWTYSTGTCAAIFQNDSLTHTQLEDNVRGLLHQYIITDNRAGNRNVGSILLLPWNNHFWATGTGCKAYYCFNLKLESADLHARNSLIRLTPHRLLTWQKILWNTFPIHLYHTTCKYFKPSTFSLSGKGRDVKKLEKKLYDSP